MSIFDSALGFASQVASLVPGYGTAVAAGINLVKSIADKVAPLVSSVVQNSPLPDDAKSLFNNAYNFAFG